MVANTKPIFPGGVRAPLITMPAGALTNPTSDTPTGVTLLCQISSGGGQGGRCKLIPTGTLTAGMLIIFKQKSTDASNVWRMIATKWISAQTVNSTTPPLAVDIPDLGGMDFEAGDKLGVGAYTTLGVPVIIDFTYYDLSQPA